MKIYQVYREHNYEQDDDEQKTPEMFCCSYKTAFDFIKRHTDRKRNLKHIPTSYDDEWVFQSREGEQTYIDVRKYFSSYRDNLVKVGQINEKQRLQLVHDHVYYIWIIKQWVLGNDANSICHALMKLPYNNGMN